MRRLLPDPLDDIDDEQIARLYAFPESTAAGRPWWRANMVASLDGSAALAGVSAGLSGPADKRVFFLLRSMADAVMVGAGTARIENYRPVTVQPQLAALRERLGQQPTPPVVLVSRSLDLDPAMRLFTLPGPRPVILTCAKAPAERRQALSLVADVLVCGEEDVDLATARELLAALGLTRIHGEGGPRLLHAQLAAGVLDELDLTVSPLLVGGMEARTVVGPALSPPAEMRLASVLNEGDVMICRYVRREESQA